MNYEKLAILPMDFIQTGTWYWIIKNGANGAITKTDDETLYHCMNKTLKDLIVKHTVRRGKRVTV